MRRTRSGSNTLPGNGHQQRNLARAVLQTWKFHVLPHLRRHMALKVDLSYAYLVLYHECTVANLLEVPAWRMH